MPQLILSGSGNPNGVAVGNPGDVFQDATGAMWVNTAFPSTWAKLSRVEIPTAVITGNTPVGLNVIARVDTSGGAVTVTLPPAFNNPGVTIIVKDVGGLAAVNNITVMPAGADTIDGAGAQVIAVSRGSLTFTSDGSTEWLVTAQVP